MADYVMMVVPKPDDTKHTIMASQTSPLMRGTNGPDNYYCGSCGDLLVATIHPNQIGGVFFRCTDCGAYNDINMASPRVERPPVR